MVLHLLLDHFDPRTHPLLRFLIDVLNPANLLGFLGVFLIKGSMELIRITGVHESTPLYLLNLFEHIDVPNHLLLGRESNGGHQANYLSGLLLRRENFVKISFVEHIDDSPWLRSHNSYWVTFIFEDFLLPDQLKRFHLSDHELNFLVVLGRLPFLSFDGPEYFFGDINFFFDFQRACHQKEKHLCLRVVFKKHLIFLHLS